MNLIEMREILADVTLQLGWEVVAKQDGPDHTYLQIQFEEMDFTTGDMAQQRGRKHRLSEYMTKSEIVTTAFYAYKQALEHEAREAFRYRGRMIFGPHINVDRLADFVASVDNLDMRTGAWVA